jgi:hypothetical protein
VKDSLVVDFVAHDDPTAAKRLGLTNPYAVAEHDFTLVCRAD